MLANKRKRLLAGTLLLAAEAFASQACLACRRSDIHAGVFNSYSFCNTSDECVEDAWNYYNRNCSSGWKRGRQLDIVDDCMA